MKAIIFMSLFISNFVIGQKTFYKLLSHEDQNVTTGLEYNSNRLILSSGSQTINTNQYKTQTNIATILLDGTPKKELEITNLNAKKFGIWDSTFVYNRLSKYENNIIISGHNRGKERETKYHIFNSDLVQQKEFSIPSIDVDRIGNEGIFVEDSILYSYGLAQIGNVYYANILKYNLSTDAILWDKNYNKGKRLNQMWDLQKTHDGNFIFIMRHTDSDAGTTVNSGNQIVKIDKSGTILDTFKYKDNGGDTFKQRILASKEGAIYYTTKNNPLEPIIPTSGRINKLSGNMDSILWSLELPSNAFTDGNRYEIFDYHQATNGDIMACGRVWHMPGGPLVAGLNASWNGFVTRVTQQGELKWLRIYRLPNDNPKLPNDKFGDFRYGQIDKIIETEDGSFVLGGTAAYTPTQRDSLKYGDTLSSIWLMVIDKNGCIEGEECENVIHLDRKKQIVNGPKLVNDKVSWTESIMMNGIKENSRYKFSKDSILFGYQYYRELMSSDNQTGNTYIGLNRYFREEDNKIFEYYQNREYLMYDFDINLNDTFNVIIPSNQITYPITANIILDSTILLNDEHRRTIGMYCKGIDPTLTTWIDGIGSTSGFLSVYNSCAFELNSLLQCFYTNDTLVYTNPESSGCWTTSTKEAIIPNFSINPNPSSEKIEIKGEILFDQINIYTSSGIKMIRNISERILDISDLPSGHYIIELEHNGRSLGKQKFVKL